MAVDVAAVRVDGLTAFRRDLKQIDKGLPRELGTVMKGAAERTVLPVARADAPRRTGTLAGSLKVGGGASKVTVRSTLPYANVIHWGGTTGRGHQLGRNHGASHIRANPFISRAAGSEMDAFAQALADALDGFFGAHGF